MSVSGQVTSDFLTNEGNEKDSVADNNGSSGIDAFSMEDNTLTQSSDDSHHMKTIVSFVINDAEEGIAESTSPEDEEKERKKELKSARYLFTFTENN